MLIDLTPADRQLIVDSLEWSKRDDLNSAYGSGKTEAEQDEEDREIKRIERLYARVIAKVGSPKPIRKLKKRSQDTGSLDPR